MIKSFRKGWVGVWEEGCKVSKQEPQLHYVIYCQLSLGPWLTRTLSWRVSSGKGLQLFSITQWIRVSPYKTFFPIFRVTRDEIAKKLKKAWVEKTKIKSKWKAQKKKESLGTSSKLLPVYDEEERDHDVEDNSSNHVQPPVLPTEIPGEQPRPHLHPSRVHIHPELPVKHSKARIPNVAFTKEQTVSREDSQAVEPPSLRELKREAYSQSALHTFRSDPLKKRDQGKRGGGSRGRGNGFIEKGRGQPNMKLRMNVMLEKIKQNLA